MNNNFSTTDWANFASYFQGYRIFEVSEMGNKIARNKAGIFHANPEYQQSPHKLKHDPRYTVEKISGFPLPPQD